MHVCTLKMLRSNDLKATVQENSPESEWVCCYRLKPFQLIHLSLKTDQHCQRAAERHNDVFEMIEEVVFETSVRKSGETELKLCICVLSK